MNSDKQTAFQLYIVDWLYICKSLVIYMYAKLSLWTFFTCKVSNTLRQSYCIIIPTVQQLRIMVDLHTYGMFNDIQYYHSSIHMLLYYHDSGEISRFPSPISLANNHIPLLENCPKLHMFSVKYLYSLFLLCIHILYLYTRFSADGL